MWCRFFSLNTYNYSKVLFFLSPRRWKNSISAGSTLLLFPAYCTGPFMRFCSSGWPHDARWRHAGRDVVVAHGVRPVEGGLGLGGRVGGGVGAGFRGGGGRFRRSHGRRPRQLRLLRATCSNSAARGGNHEEQFSHRIALLIRLYLYYSFFS